MTKKITKKRAPSIDTLTRQNVATIFEMEKTAYLKRTRGDKIADKFAGLVGSWNFIIVQSMLLVIWVILNITQAVYHWDAYPFTLLNLALSFEAAFATPIIMMSQNRQARLTELRNHLDLQINLLAEQENTEVLRLLHKLCQKQGVSLDETLDKTLEQQTKPDKIIQEIQETSIKP